VTRSNKDSTTAQSSKEPESSTEVTSTAASKTTLSETAAVEETTTVKETQAETEAKKSEVKEAGEIGLDPSWQYASFSKIVRNASLIFAASSSLKPVFSASWTLMLPWNL